MKPRARSRAAQARKNELTLGWIRYYAGRTLQMVGLLIVTGAMALFFGAEKMERPMLTATGIAGAFFVTGWLLSKKRPPGARS